MRQIVNVDLDGNVTDALYGEHIIPDRGYDFFFISDEKTTGNIMDYRKIGISEVEGKLTAEEFLALKVIAYKELNK